MPELVTLASVVSVVLTEGIKFIYKLAGEAIKRNNENKKAAQQAATIPLEVKAPDIIEGELKPLTIHTTEVAQYEPQLKELRSALNDYADETLPLEPTDTDTLQKMDKLRVLLEAVYKQPLTFRGETRPDSAINVDGHVNVTELYGTAVGVDVETITGGNVTGEGTAETVHVGGTLIGTRVKQIGGC